MVSTTRDGIVLVADRLGMEHRKTVVFLHTGGENRAVWSPIARSVCARGWGTLAPDFRGHGDSGRAESYRLDELCADTAALVDEHACEPLVMVGGSLGGVVGLLLAGGIRAAAVRGVALLDVVPNPRVEAGARERAKILAAQRRGRPEVAQLDPRLVRSGLVDEVLAQRPRIRAAARSLDVPVLLIHGSRSHVIGAEELRGFCSDIPHGDAVAVDAGHLVARDQPERVAELLIELLSKLEV